RVRNQPPVPPAAPARTWLHRWHAAHGRVGAVLRARRSRTGTREHGGQWDSRIKDIRFTGPFDKRPNAPVEPRAGPAPAKHSPGLGAPAPTGLLDPFSPMFSYSPVRER